MATQSRDDARAASLSTPIQTTKAAYIDWKSLMSTNTSTTNKKWSRGPCAACTDLLWRILVSPDINPYSNDWHNPTASTKGHWGTFALLARSSRTCDLCALIKKTILTGSKSYGNHTKPNDDGEFFAVPGSWNEFNETGKGVKHLYVSGHGRTRRFLRIFTEADDLMAGIVPGRVVAERSGGHSQLMMAKDWVDECFEQHVECRRLVSSPAEPNLPTRVIDIGDGGDAGTLRLLETNGRSGRWAALSHRWGTTSWKGKVLNRRNPILTLSLINQEELQQNIDPKRLTATFRDAIEITRALGLRYLWVDSLCIIQDDDEDWKRESSLMASVYSNAHVTVSAAVGAHGIFSERAWVKKASPVRYQVWTGGGVGTVTFDIEHINHNPTPDSNINYLESRAWCFQEAHLSPRLLTFDRTQMSLTCLRRRREESIEQSGFDGAKHKNKFLLECGSSEGSVESKQTILEMWFVLVEDYSGRNLTFASDRLVALSGIAKVINTQLGDDYMAGMWKTSPPQSLLWKPAKTDDTFHERAFPSTAQRPYRAPSWSWASMEGRIVFKFARDALNETTVASVVDMRCDSDGQDHYGTVKNGYLVIRGPLRHASCGKRGFWIGSSIAIYRHKTTANGDVKEQFAFCMLDTVLTEGSGVWCLQISAGHGLVLTRTSSVPEEYIRIGIFMQDTERRSTLENLQWWAEGGDKTIKVV